MILGEGKGHVSSARSPSIDLGFFAEAKLALQLRRAAATRTEREQRFSEAVSSA
jgi:hypothetical protein